MSFFRLLHLLYNFRLIPILAAVSVELGLSDNYQRCSNHYLCSNLDTKK
ncbi:hypothetical protein HMPREF1988_00779 [Porphyromonas gingivalis F0185]|nr:hypothetical protein HMPREF1553_00613 [Porphyromonas gingivalis F0568]ERJ84365.1 hypothetical protein HMPREF1988_00779 [Porphyromonas gingivalis F0185]